MTNKEYATMILSKLKKLETDFDRMRYLQDRIGVQVVAYNIAPHEGNDRFCTKDRRGNHNTYHTNGYAFQVYNPWRWAWTEKTLADRFVELCNTAPKGYLSPTI